MPALRIGILGSGKGSNCRSIFEKIRDGNLSAEARIVISDVHESGILEIAREFGVPATYLPPGPFRTKLGPDAELALVELLRAAAVELVVLAGFLRVLKEPMLSAFPHQIVNIHPSLLPKYPGLRAWDQALAAGETITGCSVHFVEAGIDTGAVIAQRKVAILPNDTSESVHARIQVAEHELYPEALKQFCT